MRQVKASWYQSSDTETDLHTDNSEIFEITEIYLIVKENSTAFNSAESVWITMDFWFMDLNHKPNIFLITGENSVLAHIDPLYSNLRS